MLSILTLNLRYQNPADGFNDFEHRAGSIIQCLHGEMPDLIGFQEITDDMLGIMRSAMPEYTFIGHGRNVNRHGEHNSIAFRTERFSLYTSGTFWLSYTPESPGSRFAGQGTIPRICTWAVLEYLPDGMCIAHYNTHLDHEYEKIRKLEFEVIMNHMSSTKLEYGVPVFLTGDFNMTPEESLYQEIFNFERISLADVTCDIAPTYHGFGKAATKKIDYIFTDQQNAQGVLSVRRIYNKEGKGYLSDHDGIRVDWEL